MIPAAWALSPKSAASDRTKCLKYRAPVALAISPTAEAVDADAKTGRRRGCSSTQIPYKLFTPEVQKLGHRLFQESDLGVGVAFLPHDNAYAQARAKAITNEIVHKRGLFLFGWREVPINIHMLGEKAASTLPRIEQVFVGRPHGMTDDDYERRLFLARNEIEKRAADDGVKHFYFPSFSHRVVIYKGLLVSPSLQKFYKDLQDERYETALAIYHQRYSTNTFPTWPLGHPFRMLAHNGEINTRRGNVNWMRAREAELEADFWGADIDLLKPIIQPGGSDSAELDNALEAIVMSGRSILHAMTMLVPPAWRSSEKNVLSWLQDFYEYHRCFNEPWDGPAALVFTDGLTVAACLDPERPAPRPPLQDHRRRHFHRSAPKWARLTVLTMPNIVEKGPACSRRDDRHRHRRRENSCADAEIKSALAARQPVRRLAEGTS